MCQDLREPHDDRFDVRKNVQKHPNYLVWSPMIYHSCLLLLTEAHSSLVVSMLDCQSRDWSSNPCQGKKFGSRFLFHLYSLANSAMMSTLVVHCQWHWRRLVKNIWEQTKILGANRLNKWWIDGSFSLNYWIYQSTISLLSQRCNVSKVGRKVVPWSHSDFEPFQP